MIPCCKPCGAPVTNSVIRVKRMVSVRSLFRVTAVRLSIIYTIIFGILAIGVVGYMTAGTVNVLRKQYENSIDEEVMSLAKIYRGSGINSLIRTLDRRARAPGANLYIVADPSGRIIAGNVPQLESGVMNRIGWTGKPFSYSRYGDPAGRGHRAVARVLEIPNGMRVLVGRDIGEHEGFRKVVRRAFLIVLASMILLGLLTWLLVGKRALRRIDQVSRSSSRIMAGDRDERLPVTGAGDEFDRLSENLNTMLDRIAGLDDGLKQMSDNIAHDLKTPITRLRNKADQALGLSSDPDAREDALEEIISDCDQIVKTFDALLMISRVESGASVARFSKIDLVTILRDAHELYSPVSEERGIELNLKLVGIEGAAKVEINGSRELISQAISNLIDNALKYGGGGDAGVIEIGIELGNQVITISVCDTGSGIAAKDREKVLERFARLEESRSQSGNGLGLSLVNAITKLHGGRLELKDNNPGLCVELDFPVAENSLNPAAE